MHIIRNSLIVLLLFVAVVCSVQAQNAADEQAVYEMFEAQGMRDQMNKIIVMMLQNHIQANPLLKTYQYEMMQFYAKNASYDTLKKELARIYLKHFTISEIREITKFYNSPVGRKMREKSASVLLEANELSRKKMEKAALEFLEDLRKKGKLLQ
jgi:hypothetical protein